jgi:hypothetical protein
MDPSRPLDPTEARAVLTVADLWVRRHRRLKP